MDQIVRIYIPDNNVPERLYAIKVLFEELLGVDYEVSLESAQRESLVMEVNNTFVAFEDHFFGQFPDPNSYLGEKNIPEVITTLSSFKEFVIPIIYGVDRFNIENDKVVCGLDIIASTFFMLTRWEEYVIGRKETGKCNEEDLLCVKTGYDRVPIVHIYECFLRHIFEEAGMAVECNRSFAIKTTHDVDRCYLTGWRELLCNARRIYFNGNKALARKIIKDYIWFKTRFKNPFDTYDFFMDCAEQIGIKDEFYFKCCAGNESGKTYEISDKIVQDFINHIKVRKHRIGFHPSESTFANTEQFAKEKERLFESTTPMSLIGRNHMLLITPTVYRDWEGASAEYVSNYGYQARNGFRCGIAVAFSYYDFENRQVLNVKEVPFEIMDTVMLRKQPAVEIAIEDIKEIVDIVKLHNGMLCTNWHSNVYNMRAMVSYKPVYSRMIEYVKELMG